MDVDEVKNLRFFAQLKSDSTSKFAFPLPIFASIKLQFSCVERNVVLLIACISAWFYLVLNTTIVYFTSIGLHHPDIAYTKFDDVVYRTVRTRLHSDFSTIQLNTVSLQFSYVIPNRILKSDAIFMADVNQHPFSLLDAHHVG